MKILILGNLHSLAGLQDALSGKGLPLIPSEPENGMKHHPLSGSQFDYVVLDNSPANNQPEAETAALLHQTDSSRTLILSLEGQEGQTSSLDDLPIEELDAEEVEPVIFEYHAPCASTKKH